MVPDIMETAWLFVIDVLKIQPGAWYNPLTWLANKVDNSNINLQQDWLPIKYIPRSPKHQITADFVRQYVKSGDIFSCFGRGGLDSLILSGTGGPVTHSAIAMWQNETFWVVEASGGLIRTKLEDFMSSCYGGSIWQPLAPKYRAKFDIDKAWAWFENGIENRPYSYETLLFTWMDTPDQNFP